MHYHVLAVGPRLGADVNGDVDDDAAGAAHQLGLGVRRLLTVQTTQRARGVIEADIRLRDAGIQPMIGEFVGTERTREEAAIVVMRFEVDDHHPCEIGGCVLHSALFPEQVPIDLSGLEQVLNLLQSGVPATIECLRVHRDAVRPSWSRRRSRCSPCCCRRSAPSGRVRWLVRRWSGSCDPTG